MTLFGWLVPRLLSRVWPEGVRPLIALAVVSAGILFLMAVVMMVAIYVAGGVPFARLLELGTGAFLIHFGTLGLISALFWGPLLILSVAGLPKYWERETW